MLATRTLGALALAAVATLVAAPAAQAADYFPLHVGDKWDYVQTPVGPRGLHSTLMSSSIDRKTTSAGVTWFHLVNFQGGDHWVRETSTPRVLERPGDLWYRWGAAVGASWTMAINGGLPGSDGATLTLGSKTETVTVSAGTFKNCIRIDYKTNVADAGVTSEWFAPGVGLVKRIESRIYGSMLTELSDAVVAGKVYPVPPPLVATMTVTPDTITLPGILPVDPTTGLPIQPSYNFTATLHIAATGASVKVTEGGYHCDFILRDPNGNEVYRWSKGKMFAQYIRNVTINKNGIDYSVTFSTGPLPIGSCSLEGIAVINPAPASVFMPITVIAAP